MGRVWGFGGLGVWEFAGFAGGLKHWAKGGLDHTEPKGSKYVLRFRGVHCNQIRSPTKPFAKGVMASLQCIVNFIGPYSQLQSAFAEVKEQPAILRSSIKSVPVI